MNKKLLFVFMFAFSSNSILYPASANQDIAPDINLTTLSPEQIAAVNAASQQVLAMFIEGKHKDILSSSHSHHNTFKYPFACTECPKSFKIPSGLNKHLRTHCLEKPFKCTFCPDAFSDRSTLKNHIRIHTGERPHSCPICKVNFSRAADLRRHLKGIHPEEKPYSCPTCNDSFSFALQLKQHTATYYFQG